jgi:hypothetical protein
VGLFEMYIVAMRVVVLRIEGSKIEIKRPDDASTYRICDLEGVLRDSLSPIPADLKVGDVVRVTIAPILADPDQDVYFATPETEVVRFHQG